MYDTSKYVSRGGYAFVIYSQIRLIRIRLIRIAGSNQDFSPDKPLL